MILPFVHISIVIYMQAYVMMRPNTEQSYMKQLGPYMEPICTYKDYSLYKTLPIIYEYAIYDGIDMN